MLGHSNELSYNVYLCLSTFLWDLASDLLVPTCVYIKAEFSVPIVSCDFELSS